MILLSLRLEGEETLKSRCVCIGLRAEKFNIVNNDHGGRHKCDFSASDRKYPFWTNLVQNIRIVSLIWNFVPKQIGICRIQWWCSIFPFLTGNTSVVIGYARMRKTSEMRPIFLGVQMLPYKNEKSLDLQNYSRISAFQILLLFQKPVHLRYFDVIYLMVSKLLYLLMDWETFNS